MFDLTTCEPYILNDKNMYYYLKYQLNNINKNYYRNKQNNINYKKYNKQYFIPKEQDKLFWCYYLIRRC